MARHEKPSAELPALEPGMSRPALEAWADHHGIRWALDQSHPQARWVQVSLGEVIYTRSQRWWSSTALKLSAIALLEELAVHAGGVRRFAEERLEAWRTPPTDAVLRPLWQRALAQHQRLSAIGPPSLQIDEAALALDPPTLCLAIGELSHRIPLDGKSLELPAEHHLAFAAVIELLELLDDPPSELTETLASPQWQRDLRALDSLMRPEPLPESDDKRLLGWEIRDDAGALELNAVQCRYTRAGRLQCRRVQVQDLPASLMTEPADARVASLLHRWRRPPREVVLEALQLLAGHPRIVVKQGSTRETIEVRTGPLELHLSRSPDGLEVCWKAAGRSLQPTHLLEALSSADAAGGRLALSLEGEVLVIGCTEPQRELVEAWLQRAPHLPPEALPELLARLPDLQRLVPVRLAPQLRGTPLQGDDRPLFRVSFRGSCVVVEARVQPLPDAPAQVPGEGPDTLHVVREGQPACLVRDRLAEPGLVATTATALGLTEAWEQRPFLWAIDDLEAALDVVRSLDPQTHRLEVSGELPRVGASGAAGLSLSVRSGRDWFAVDGQLETELGSIALAQILAAVEEGRSYVALDQGGYVRLEEAMLQRLAALTAASRGSALQITAVHAPLLQALEREGASIEGPEAFQSLHDRMIASASAIAAVPDGLQAELRPYQLEGFRWLASLADWAPGAVLADDMGLGKTVQAIALLLRRSDDGPALVVAPTSVAFNWRDELARFAPGLRVVSFAGADRASLLEDLQPGDVVVCSYGVLLRDAIVLAGIAWSTVVLDEAQAIKNPMSKRAKAAVGLSAGFRLGLSGTPLQNRAEDLWSIFAATVPGLLGTLQRFRERFGPRSTDTDRRRAALSRLIAPFLLRRTKGQVARELPPRTSILERIGLSGDHRALYLRHRAQALARISDAPSSKRRFLVLGELTRLRQLACDPRLLDAGAPLVGNKIVHLLHRLQEVRDAGARALVFSTFVGLLELARAAIEAEGFRVAWLTGATPADQRQAEVNRFQAGEADVFLISLKAGGTGLNLTAASYVFLLDPWWNPSAEDQATDRTHRIGQTEPVTVYRLVAAGTIEEQILELHEDKRDLVDTVLAGSGSARTVSPDELLALLADPGVPEGEDPLPDLVDAPEAAPASSAPDPARSAPAPASDEGAPGSVPGAPGPAPDESAPGPTDPAREPPPGEPSAAGATSRSWLQGQSLAEVLRRAHERLDAEGLKPSTVGHYRRAVEQFVRWAREQGAQGGSELPGMLERYAEAVRAGELPRSRLPPLRAAWARLGDPHGS